MVRFGDASGLTERWFEVKVDATESGNQLDRYRTHLAALPEAGRPLLITLARRPIRDDGSPFLSWRAVHAAARDRTTPHWQDLADWLEELHMADVHDGAITLDELEALPGAVALYEKVCRVLADLCTEAGGRYPDFAWPPAREVAALIVSELSFRGRFMLRVPPRAGGHTRIYLGAYTAGGPGIGLWVESDPKYGPQRRAMLDLADRNGLPAAWERHLATWQALQATLQPTAVIDQSSLLSWFLDRLGELQAVGVLDLLPRLGKGAWADPDS